MMIRSLPVIGVALAALAGTAAAQTAASAMPPLDGVVAVVGDQPILRSDVQSRIEALRASGRPIPTDSAGQAAMLLEAVNSLVDEELLVQQAKVLKLEVPDADISTTVDQQMQRVRQRFTSEQEFRDQLRLSGFGTPDEYKRYLMDEARRSALQQKLFEKLKEDGKLPPVPVSDSEITAFFEANKANIPKAPATVTFRQVVITPKASPKADSAALAKAESILVELRKGGDFEQIAKRESMDPGTKELGGDLGWRRRGDFVPAFERVYFALPPGQISPIVKTSFGYHIIRIDRVQPSEVKGRHILIIPKVDSADIAAARAEAGRVAEEWRKGANFDSLVAKYHDPAEEHIMPTPFPIEQLPTEYQAAIKGHKAGEILDPFAITDKTRGVPKFFVVQLTNVTEAHEPSVADFRQRIRDQLVQEKAVRRYLDQLRQQTYVAIHL